MKELKKIKSDHLHKKYFFMALLLSLFSILLFFAFYFLIITELSKNGIDVKVRENATTLDSLEVEFCTAISFFSRSMIRI